jgi:hypothetical protein
MTIQMNLIFLCFYRQNTSYGHHQNFWLTRLFAYSFLMRVDHHKIGRPTTSSFFNSIICKRHWLQMVYLLTMVLKRLLFTWCQCVPFWPCVQPMWHKIHQTRFSISFLLRKKDKISRTWSGYIHARKEKKGRKRSG